MKALLQRVSRAAVRVDGAEAGAIGPGLLVFLGVSAGDTGADAERLAERVAHYRVFEDDAGKMNRSLLETGGRALVVSQFTLCAETSRGRRPGFDPAAPPALAEPLCERFCEALERHGVAVGRGRFGASMEVELVNRGPVTFLLEQPPAREGPGAGNG
ncbi:MAG TPA: D-aminoacyl-tRNA deacylase [Candidatus Eisenbacteria bacterium]|nr:D-aminoacyl-tRNA deacylase [Candidatus Eisenbacteria bacterium]